MGRARLGRVHGPLSVPDTQAPPRRTRPWVKALGLALILLVWLPLLIFLGSMAYVSLSASRAEAAAEKARAAVRIGDSLGSAVASSSAIVGQAPLLECYEATCVGRPEIELAHRTTHAFRVLAADGTASQLKTVEEWRQRLPGLDHVDCRRVKMTFCGRPWMTFFAELDGSRRVSQVGPLRVSAE
jgi:hypothetical protein